MKKRISEMSLGLVSGKWYYLQIIALFLLLSACGGGDDKGKQPRVAPIALLVDTNQVRTEAMGMGWFSHINQDLNLRLKLPRANASDLVEKDGTIKFVAWVQTDTAAYKAGLICYLADERGFLLQAYKRPYMSFGKEYVDFNEFGSDFYRANSNYHIRYLENGAYVNLQDSLIHAFQFDTKVDFGKGKRTPMFLYPDRMDDPNEDILQRTNARVLYFSHKQYNFRIIYERGNSLTEGIFSSLQFF